MGLCYGVSGAELVVKRSVARQVDIPLDKPYRVILRLCAYDALAAAFRLDIALDIRLALSAYLAWLSQNASVVAFIIIECARLCG